MDLLRALGTFVRITETGSFSAVARESNSTPSAVTRLIGQLEEHFRVRLFHRTTRHLSLTEDGQDLLAHARNIIEATTDLEDTIGNQPTDASLVARSVGEFGRALVASPSYLERHGAPSDPAALTMHRCIVQEAEA